MNENDDETRECDDCCVPTTNELRCDDCQDNYSDCVDCGDETHHDDLNTTGAGDSVCDDCRDNYYTCEDCSDLVHADHTQSAGYDRTVCDGCYESNYSYCEGCDQSYHHDDPCDCNEGCDCEAPGQAFRVRNGETHLHNDERVSISLPDGFLSDEGIGAISRQIRTYAGDMPPSHVRDEQGNYVRDEIGATITTDEYVEWLKWRTLSYDLESIGNEWQGKSGN